MGRYIAILTLLVISIASPRAGYSDESTPIPFDPYHVPGINITTLAPYSRAGNGIIEGRLVAKTQLFGEVAFPKTRVDLLPATMLTWWILRSAGYSIEHDDYKDHDPLPSFPSELVAYRKSTFTDAAGYFRFSDLPDGRYYISGQGLHETFEQPNRYTTEERTAANGDSVTTLEKSKGFKERSDLVVLAASATIDGKDHSPSWTVTGFDIFGESTCCKAEI
jgi:hypothetical protein